MPFGTTHRYPDGVTLRVSEIVEAKLGPFPATEDPESKEGDPFVRITLAYDNRSRASVELTPHIVVRVGPDGREAFRVYEGEARDALYLKPANPPSTTSPA